MHHRATAHSGQNGPAKWAIAHFAEAAWLLASNGPEDQTARSRRHIAVAAYTKFLYQLIEANFGIFGSAANGGGVAFFAHVGGFVFGAIVAWLLTGAGLVAPQDRSGPLRAPA